MGLDAVVFCDCVEKKRLKVPHPYPRKVFIEANGSPEIRSEDSAEIERHDQWMELPPCKHESVMMDGCEVGNVWYVNRVYDALVAVLKPPLPRCPVLLGKVLYDGTHTGDHLTRGQVQKLASELQQLKKVDLKRAGLAEDDRKAVKDVIAKLTRLTKTAQRIDKPIAF
jgi:hypothetical protein